MSQLEIKEENDEFAVGKSLKKASKSFENAQSKEVVEYAASHMAHDIANIDIADIMAQEGFQVTDRFHKVWHAMSQDVAKTMYAHVGADGKVTNGEDFFQAVATNASLVPLHYLEELATSLGIDTSKDPNIFAPVSMAEIQYLTAKKTGSDDIIKDSNRDLMVERAKDATNHAGDYMGKKRIEEYGWVDKYKEGDGNAIENMPSGDISKTPSDDRLKVIELIARLCNHGWKQGQAYRAGFSYMRKGKENQPEKTRVEYGTGVIESSDLEINGKPQKINITDWTTGVITNQAGAKAGPDADKLTQQEAVAAEIAKDIIQYNMKSHGKSKQIKISSDTELQSRGKILYLLAPGVTEQFTWPTK